MKTLITLLITFAAFVGSPAPALAWGDGPLWDAKVIVGDTADISCGDGFVKNPQDLNAGAGGKWVFLCQSFTQGHHAQPIAGLIVCNVACPAGYDIVRSEPANLVGYLNAGVSGGYLLVFGFYRGMTAPIRQVRFSLDTGTSADLCRELDIAENWQPMPGIQDLNRGGGGAFITPCVLYTPGGARDAYGLIWDLVVVQGYKPLCPLEYEQLPGNMNSGVAADELRACINDPNRTETWHAATGTAIAGIGTVAITSGETPQLAEACAETGGVMIEPDLNADAAGRKIHFCVTRARTPQDPDRSVNGFELVVLAERPERPEAVCAQYRGEGWEPVRAVNEEGVNDLNAGAGGDFVYACQHKSAQYVEDAFDAPILNPEPMTEFRLTATSRDASGNAQASLVYSVTASDPQDGDLAIQCTPPSGTTFTRKTVLGLVIPQGFDCSATDTHGNTTSGGYLVTVVDEPPLIASPGDLTLEAGPKRTRVVTYDVPATILGSPAPATCNPASGATFPVGVTSVSCRATDGVLSSAISFTVTILAPEAPVLTLPADIRADGKGGSAIVPFTVTAADAFDGANTIIECGVYWRQFDDAREFAVLNGNELYATIGEHRIYCVAGDSATNQSVGSFAITIEDRSAPWFIRLPADLQFEATGPAGVVLTGNQLGEVKAADIESFTQPIITRSPAGNAFALGITLVTWTASDPSGNTATCTQTITVVDTVPPVFTIAPVITVQATSEAGATLISQQIRLLTVSDNIQVAYSSRTPAGYSFPIGTTVVTWTVGDWTGNETTATQQIVVLPVPAPQPEPTPEPTPGPPSTPSVDQQIDEIDELISITRLDNGLSKLARALKREKAKRACAIAANLTDAIERLKLRKLADADRAELLRRMATLRQSIGCAAQ